MIDIWNQARLDRRCVNLDTDHFNAVIYKGVKIINNRGDVKIYCTDTEFYTEITDIFKSDDFFEGVQIYLRDKYLKKMEDIERLIRLELNGNKNHKKFSYLKSMREFYINKYNENNFKEITRR
jgi:hypothetical protein